MYIDRGILANAYVSGMREGMVTNAKRGLLLTMLDLELFGNEFVQLGSVFTVGYATCVGLFPIFGYTLTALDQ